MQAAGERDEHHSRIVDSHAAPADGWGGLENLSQTLWLMRRAQPQDLIEISGVVAVQFLAGYSGSPEQSRILRVVTRHEVGCDRFQTTN